MSHWDNFFDRCSLHILNIYSTFSCHLLLLLLYVLNIIKMEIIYIFHNYLWLCLTLNDAKLQSQI